MQVSAVTHYIIGSQKFCQIKCEDFGQIYVHFSFKETKSQSERDLVDGSRSHRWKEAETSTLETNFSVWPLMRIMWE